MLCTTVATLRVAGGVSMEERRRLMWNVKSRTGGPGFQLDDVTWHMAHPQSVLLGVVPCACTTAALIHNVSEGSLLRTCIHVVCFGKSTTSLRLQAQFSVSGVWADPYGGEALGSDRDGMCV